MWPEAPSLAPVAVGPTSASVHWHELCNTLATLAEEKTTTIINTRLSRLGVPAVFHPEIAARRAPRFHILLHVTIILASIAAAVAAIAVWSRYVAAAAVDTAKSAHAILYDSDIGAVHRSNSYCTVRGRMALRSDHLAAR